MQTQMNVVEMRKAIAKVYSGWEWKRKVLNMDEGQVIAVYHAFEHRGLLTNKPAPVPQKEPVTYDLDNLPSIQSRDVYKGEQLSIFD